MTGQHKSNIPLKTSSGSQIKRDNLGKAYRLRGKLPAEALHPFFAILPPLVKVALPAVYSSCSLPIFERGSTSLLQLKEGDVIKDSCQPAMSCNCCEDGTFHATLILLLLLYWSLAMQNCPKTKSDAAYEQLKTITNFATSSKALLAKAAVPKSRAPTTCLTTCCQLSPIKTASKLLGLDKAVLQTVSKAAEGLNTGNACHLLPIL